MSKSVEIWKPIKDYEGYYEVSNYGNVRSVGRYIDFGCTSYHYNKPRILSAISHGNGYLYVTLVKNKKRKNKYIHRLVAENFLENINNKPCVNHKDFDRANNDVNNLEWVTYSENIRWSAKNGNFNKPKNNHKTNKLYGKYIRFKSGKYEVSLPYKYIGRFNSLEDAISERNKYVKECNNKI